MKSINATFLLCAVVIGATFVSPIKATAAQSTTGSNQSGDADSVIWIARLRTGRVVTFRVSVSRTFNAAAVIASVGAAASAAGDLAVFTAARDDD
jgi:hypothetical protein